jgi:succinate-semialdehyde dehydrogenase / glutarate-semialdehyde dehydrogenase
MTYRTINPATGETVRTFADISDADLDDALEVAQSCYQNDWRHRPVADRARIVKAAAAELRANAAEYARYVTAEIGKLIGTSTAPRPSLPPGSCRSRPEPWSKPSRSA